MRIKLIRCVFSIVLIIFAKSTHAKTKTPRIRRPPADPALDSDGKYIDQIASDSIHYSSSHNTVVTPPPDFGKENSKNIYRIYANHEYSSEYEKPNDGIDDQIHSPKHLYSPEEYVHNSMKMRQKLKNTHQETNNDNPANSFLEYTTVKFESTKKPQHKRKYENRNNFGNFHYESKRIKAKPEPNYHVANNYKNDDSRFYKPESPDAIITKEETPENGDDSVSTYHYYYPAVEESLEGHDKHQNEDDMNPRPRTQKPKTKSHKTKKTPIKETVEFKDEYYEYEPVLQRPNSFVGTTEDVEAVYPVDESVSTKQTQYYYPAYTSYENQYVGVQSTTPVPTASIKQKKIVADDSFKYKQSSSSSDDSSRINVTVNTKIKMKSPQTNDAYHFPSPSTTSSPIDYNHEGFSSTVGPNVTPDYKYIYPSSTPSSTISYKSPSPVKTTSTHPVIATKSVPSTVSTSLYKEPSDDYSDHVVVIKPKTEFKNHKTQYYPVTRKPKKTIVYAFSEDEVVKPNQTNYKSFGTTRSPYFESIPTPIGNEGYNDSMQTNPQYVSGHIQNKYAYHDFTMEDAGKFGDLSKSDFIYDDTKKASKKNMMFRVGPNDYDDSPYTDSLEEREMPTRGNFNGPDLSSEPSKHKYYVLYDIDQDNEKAKKKKYKNPHQDIVTHIHHHDYRQEHPSAEESRYEPTPEQETQVKSSIRIIDPMNKRQPIELTKEDYIKNIKQAVVQYMNEVGHGKDLKETIYRTSKAPVPVTTMTPYRKPPTEAYNFVSSLKLPNNVYHAGGLKDAIDELQEAPLPNVDLTIKKSKTKPFDLSAIDVGQSYQHVIHHDNPSQHKHSDNLDQINSIHHPSSTPRPKLHFSQQTYHDINSLGHAHNIHNPIQKTVEDDEDAPKLFKGYYLPKVTTLKPVQSIQHQTSDAMRTVEFDRSKLPKIIHNDNDERPNPEEPLDAPIQIINGIPVANPYNIDLNTLKYMLGGIAQAQVNDQIKDLDEQSKKSHDVPKSWNSFQSGHFQSGPMLGSFTNNVPVYQVYNNNNNNNNNINKPANPNQDSSYDFVDSYFPQREKKNSQSSGHFNQQKAKQQNVNSQFPLVNGLTNYKMPRLNNNNNNNLGSSQQNFNLNQNVKTKNKNNFGIGSFHDFSSKTNVDDGWGEPTPNKDNKMVPMKPLTFYNPKTGQYLRPATPIKNKNAPDRKFKALPPVKKSKTPATELQPPPVSKI